MKDLKYFTKMFGETLNIGSIRTPTLGRPRSDLISQLKYFPHAHKRVLCQSELFNPLNIYVYIFIAHLVLGIIYNISDVVNFQYLLWEE